MKEAPKDWTLYKVYTEHSAKCMWYGGPAVNSNLLKCENCLVERLDYMAHKYCWILSSGYGERLVCDKCHMLWWHRIDAETNHQD